MPKPVREKMAGVDTVQRGWPPTAMAAAREFLERVAAHVSPPQ